MVRCTQSNLCASFAFSKDTKECHTYSTTNGADMVPYYSLHWGSQNPQGNVQTYSTTNGADMVPYYSLHWGSQNSHGNVQTYRMT